MLVRHASTIDEERVEIHKIFPNMALMFQAMISMCCFVTFLVYWLHMLNVKDGLDVER